MARMRCYLFCARVEISGWEPLPYNTAWWYRRAEASGPTKARLMATLAWQALGMPEMMVFSEPTRGAVGRLIVALPEGGGKAAVDRLA